MALVMWDVPISDQNIIILLNAINNPDLDVQLTIISCIRERIHVIIRGDYCENLNITPELIDQAILTTKSIILKYINHPDPEIRDRAISQLSTIDPDERYLLECVYFNPPIDLSTQLELLDNPEWEIREAAISSIIELGSVAIFPIVLALASNSKLVAILISALRRLADKNANSAIFSKFHRDRDVSLKFIETAEKTCIQNIRNKAHHVNGEVFALGSIGSDLGILVLQEILEAQDSYDDVDQAIDSLAAIGTESAMSVLLSFLPDLDIFYGWIAIQFHNLGKLGLIPHLWSAERQVHSYRGAELIATIQEREGLYNPDFSDRPHPLFDQPKPRLRDILLGNNATEI